MPRVHDDTIDQKILDATLVEIDANGVISLNVAHVALTAETTVAMIYRLFENRDGLIAACLSRFYEERFVEIIDTTRLLVHAKGAITIDDVMSAVAPLRFDGSARYHQRMQRVYAVASENPRLRASVRETARRGLAEYEELVTDVVARLPEDQQFDPRIMPLVLLRHNALIDDVLGDAGLSNEEFRDFLRSLLVNSARARQRLRASNRSRAGLGYSHSIVPGGFDVMS